MDIKQILEKIEEVDPSNLNLFFITRVLKPKIKMRDKVLDKYLFVVYQIEVVEEIKKYLYDLSIKQFEKMQKNNDLKFHDYDVFSDDSEHLFTYSMKNKVMSFSDVVYNQLKGTPKKITDLNEILSSEQLWAYCVEFQMTSEDNFYTFRKLNPGKVGVDEKESESKKILSSLRTIFDTNSNKLSLLKGETIYLDKQIDCIFFEETFYILKKAYFEQIIGLQEEYKAQAESFVTDLSTNPCFGNINLLKEKIKDTPSIHKKLVRVEKLGNVSKLDSSSLQKLEELGKSKNTELNIKDGKIIFETEKDIENTIKLLSDYFKIGEFSGKSYGTFAGKVIPEK
jgi:hypothetical protein